MKLVVFLLSCTLLLSSALHAQEIIREGNIYATVDIEQNGDIKVLDVYSDLPSDTQQDIEGWLERQAIVLPDVATKDNRIIELQYQVTEEDGNQYLTMAITNTNASLPEAAAKGIPVQVRVHLREDGRVESVEPESDLPPGVSKTDLEETVAQNIENDPAVIEAAEENRLSDTTETMTVIIKQRENQ